MKPDFTATKVWLPLYQGEESSVCHREPIGLRFCRDLLPVASVFQRDLQLLLHLIVSAGSLDPAV